jgi:hypothetical protein
LTCRYGRELERSERKSLGFALLVAAGNFFWITTLGFLLFAASGGR